MDSKLRGSGAATTGNGDPTELFAGRYQLLADLKRGNGVDTYLSVDASTSTQVVVKCIDNEGVHAAARLRFEHETRVLRQLTGTGLTGLYDAGSAADRLYRCWRPRSGRPHGPCFGGSAATW